MWKPASKPSLFSRWRLTEAGSTRRSATSTPVELRPEIIARLTIRQAAGDSRLATTRAPRFSAVPRAAARRTAVSGVRRDAAVVAEEGRALDRLKVVDLHPLAQPDVAAQADAVDVQPDPLVEGVEVRLPELVEIADVLPVSVEHVPVQRAAHLQQQR